MKQSTQDILREFRELFPDVSEKKLLGEIKNLQELQNISKPNAQYKKDLKLRLQNLYEIEHDTQKTSVFGWLQYIGIFTSFVFIFGIAFSLYDIQKDGFSPVSVQEQSHQYQEVQEAQLLDIQESIPDDLGTQAKTKDFDAEFQTQESAGMGDFQEADAVQTNAPLDESSSETMMMGARMIENPSEDGRFLCESNSGNVSPDGEYCTFDDNTLCALTDIEDCLSKLGE